MDAYQVLETVEQYIRDREAADIDGLEGPYAAKGILMEDADPVERLEVGEVLDTGYRPLIKLRLGTEPGIDNDPGSYLGMDGFAGSVYHLSGEEYDGIREFTDPDIE